MELDIERLQRFYFSVDEPIPFALRNNTIVHITPISVKDAEQYEEASIILKLDKNSSSDPLDISMSYLAYLVNKVFKPSPQSVTSLGYLMYKCLGLDNTMIMFDERRKPYIAQKGDSSVVITPRDFDNIKRIILFQNDINYDDTYIDADYRKAIMEVAELKQKNIDIPNLERKCAIITAHCGLSKKEQLEMTYRSHQQLFEECVGEVEFETIRPIALYAGKSGDLDHWVYKRKKSKYDDYTMSVSDFNKSMGGNGDVRVDDSSDTRELLKQYENMGG